MNQTSTMDDTNENAIQFTPCKLNFFILRITGSNENWKIQLVFDRKMKYDFEKIHLFTRANKSDPVLYRLALDVHLFDDGQMLISYEEEWRRIDSYWLRISQAHSNSPTTHYCDDRTHSLTQDLTKRDYFFFDTNFVSNNLWRSTPGHNLPWLSQLCLFSYSIVLTSCYELFESLMKQFTEYFTSHTGLLSENDVNSFFRYSEYFNRVIPSSTDAIKVFVRMISVIPMQLLNEVEKYESIKLIALLVLKTLSETSSDFWATVLDEEWNSLCQGFVILICIAFFHNDTTRRSNYCSMFLCMITGGIKRRKIIIRLLEGLQYVKCIPTRKQMVEFYAFMGMESLTLEYLELAVYLEIYINYLTKLIYNQNLHDSWEDIVSRQIQKLLQSKALKVELQDIASMAAFMKSRMDENDDEDTMLIQKLHALLQDQSLLWHRIAQHLEERKSNIHMDEFPLIQNIFLRSYDPSLLPTIYPQDYLCSLLTRRHNHSSEYLIAWFKCFLCESRPNWMHYRSLLEKWTNCFQLNQALFSNIIQKIDSLIESWERVTPDDTAHTYEFVQHMVNQCFQQSNNVERIFELIKDDLQAVQNQNFIEAFVEKFRREKLLYPQELLKNLHNPKNPLLFLLQMNQGLLRNELLRLITSTIRITSRETIDEAFYQSSTYTLTYLVLSHESFQLLPIHQDMLRYLNDQWERWKCGICPKEILIWSKLNEGQKNVIYRIWSLVTGTAGEHQIQILFDTNYRDMQRKLDMYDKVIICLSNYCKKACDYDTYNDELRQWYDHFQSTTIGCIEMPTKLQDILPYGEHLNAYCNARNWRTFLNKSMSIDVKGCLEILSRTMELWKRFLRKLDREYSSGRQSLLKQILDLFPDIEEAGNDLQLLKARLNSATATALDSILSFWKKRQQIQHICHGLCHLGSRFSVKFDETFYNQMCSINENSFIHECIQLCQQYQKQLETVFSEKVLTFISYYSSSSDLFTFLHSLTDDDIASLKEAGQDRGENLMDTSTIFDLANIRSFLDRTYDTIKAAQRVSQIEMNHLILCFERSWPQQSDEVDLCKCLESSSLSLSSIKYIYLTLTDKEQSKRRCISDILQESLVGFVRMEKQNEISFDAKIRLSKKEGKQSMALSDLSELRDRARLLEHSARFNHEVINTRDQESEKEKLHNFIEFVGIIESIIRSTTELYTTGNFAALNCLEDKKTFACIEGNYKDLKEHSILLEDMVKKWQIELCHRYEKCPALTYLSCEEFWEVDDYIHTRSSPMHPGYHLTRYMNINVPSNRGQNHQCSTPEERSANLVNLLSIHKRASISQKANTKSKFYIVETTEEGILRAILSIFSFTKTTPNVSQLFYCTSNMKWFQVQGFIYRSFFSQSYNLLIQPELLSQSIQDQCISLVRLLSEQNLNHSFHMSIITTTSITDQHLINGLQSINMVDVLRDYQLYTTTEFRQEIQKLIGSHHKVTSRLTGLGKSTRIRQKIAHANKKYVKFPIVGDFDVDTLAKKLRAMYLELDGAALHIDIGVTENIKQLNQMVYCLILFGGFRLGNTAVFLPKNTPIYIELDSSHESGLNKISFLDHFSETEHIDSIDWKKLNTNNPELQTVVHYLLAIQNGTIALQNISLSPVKTIETDTCIRLFREQFLRNKNSEFISWTQISIMIAVLYRLFIGFSRCGYFLVEFVSDQNLRMALIQTLLQSSNFFTTISVERVRHQQRQIHTEQSTTFDETIVRWDTLRPFTMVFTSTDEPIFVYKKPSDIPRALRDYFELYSKAVRGTKQTIREDIFPDYTTLTHEDFFIKLALLSKKFINKSICLRCYRQYEYKCTQCSKCHQETLVRPKSIDYFDVLAFQIEIAEKLKYEYVLTPDNFIKMLLIYTRIQSKIPVLIMGETGCGKTSLVRFLCEKILDDDLEIYQVHAGIKSEHIVEKMHSYIVQAETCKNMNKRLWIFFDEFNTTYSIGLLKEIICDRTLLGTRLPENIVFLGACNPRRNKSKKLLLNEDVHVGLRKTRYTMLKSQYMGIERQLLHMVVPTPETMLEYIWDYGYLNEFIERSYIKTMINSCHNLSCHSELYSMTIELLINSQNHFRELEDASSVSLRDIARFCRLYNWFLESAVCRDKENQSQSLSVSLSYRASLNALLLCYYFRLRSDQLKEDYIRKMHSIMVIYDHSVSQKPDYLIKSILEEEEKDLIDKRMELPKGTATNRTLRDNIFVLLTCIINRIPIFMCGKPGSSKSSAVQIVISNLKGKRSRDPYFQTLPELVTVSFQGSQNCTSESIIKVFERASGYSSAKSQSVILPVIVFDEIGLAELSIHNPLKVLHAELEVENNRFGFVGISNWRLDASKMNRALYLSTSEANIQDLTVTGQKIFDCIEETAADVPVLDSSIIESLSRAYYDFQEKLKINEVENQYYFGLRDFYCLIKGIAQDVLLMKNKIDIYEIIRRQLKINFDGVLDGSVRLWDDFCGHINRRDFVDRYAAPQLEEILDCTLRNRSGRYLMLIANNNSVIDHAERFIMMHQQKQNIPVRTLTGSLLSGDLLPGDTYTEQYSDRILMDIILYAETKVTLIMRQMGHIYDNLYDLFNQNYAVSAKKKYCRIPLGALYHPRCLIHEEFYCVVFIRQEDLEKCDLPFLNRFEKHLIDMNTLIHPQHISIARKLHLWLENLLPNGLGKHFPLLQHLFVNYSQDHVVNLIMETFEELNVNINIEINEEEVENIFTHCRTKLLYTGSLDLPLILSLHPNREKQQLVDQYYDIHRQITLEKLVQELSTDVNSYGLRVIYTYTQVFQRIKNLPQNVDTVKLSAFKTEDELKTRIKFHYRNSQQKHPLLLIRIDYHSEHKHTLALKHILLNEHVPSANRAVWLLFHLQRNLLNQISNDVLFPHCPAYMIDDLDDDPLIYKDIFQNPSFYQLALQPQFVLSECVYDELVDRCLSKFRYTTSNETEEEQINIRRQKVFQLLTSLTDRTYQANFSLRSIVEENLLILIQNLEKTTNQRFRDWRLEILENGRIVAGSRSFHQAFQVTISEFYEIHLFLLLAHMETHNFFDSYLSISNLNDEHVRHDLTQLWTNHLKSTLENVNVTYIDYEQLDINITFNTYLPCAALEYNNIRAIQEKFQSLGQQDIVVSDQYNRVIEWMKNKSIYGENFIELIFSQQQLFRYYLHDQITFYLNEAKLHLSVEFVITLLISNCTRSPEQTMYLFLVQHTEFTEVLQLFETASKLSAAEKIQTLIRNQFILGVNMIKPSEYYSLVVNENKYYQLPPKQLTVSDELIIDCQGDPIIEISLMNLIEFILSPSIINRATSIEELTTVYGSIAQGIRHLSSYVVNNLEKLRSFLSVIRYITTVSTTDALLIFKDICRDNLVEKFSSCTNIHLFINALSISLEKKRSVTVSQSISKQTALKLEVELLKDWLADHSDDFHEILVLIHDDSNDLWYYSAKIFSYIDRKLDLLSTLKSTNGKMILDEDQERLNAFFDHVKNNKNQKIQKLMVNRFHMNLMRDVQQKTLENKLMEGFQNFGENLEALKQKRSVSTVQHIATIAWLKYYAQSYAFALHTDSKNIVLKKIDEVLSTSRDTFSSSVKLFILKQLLQISGLRFNELREQYFNRHVLWITPFIQKDYNQETRNIRRELILPTPLFECQDEFRRISRVFNQLDKYVELKHLIGECGKSQKLSYSFLCWFIQYHCRFTVTNTDMDVTFVQVLERDLKDELIKSFTPFGHRFLISLCSNFSKNSYFRLNHSITMKELQKKLVALNIVAIFISLRSSHQITLLGNLLFNDRCRFPTSYVQHLSSIAVPGLNISNPIVAQMIDVRTQVQDRLNRGVIHTGGKFIFQCNKDCLWMFYFENCGVPNDRKICPLCKKPIGAERYGVLIDRNPPQIKMSIDQGFKIIDNYINDYNKTVRLGYHNTDSAAQSMVGDKPDHLNRYISFCFIRLLTHGLLVSLQDLNYLSENDMKQTFKLKSTAHFKEHFERDYDALIQFSGDHQQGYIWLYNLLNHMLDHQLLEQGLLNNNENVIRLEKTLEQKLIFPHLSSPVNEITDYKRAYSMFIEDRHLQPSIEDFIDETSEDENQYALLSFFNVTTFHTSNLLDEFILKIQRLPYAEEIYPLTRFILKKLDDYLNIQHLYPMVTFSNHLIEKLNHRIKRDDAATKSISHYLYEGSDRQLTKQLFDNFLYAWYELKLKEVRFGCQNPKLERSVAKDDFAEKSSIATVLLNTSKDESSLLLAACLKTIGDLQNEIVNYFYNVIEKSMTTNMSRKKVRLQAIRLEHTLCLDRHEINKKLIDDCIVVNYQYGKGRDLIYDYEEIEMYFRNMISSLVLIDTETLHFLNYQFELYAENASLINDVRVRVKQSRLTHNEQVKLNNCIAKMSNDDVLNFLGSLDYTFTYLRNSKGEHASTTTSIQTFVQHHIQSQSCLNENTLGRPPFSSIQLQFLIHLYEILEEHAFDHVLRPYVKKELLEDEFSAEEREEVLSRFSHSTFQKETIVSTLNRAELWIAMLKRLMIRVLNSNVSLDVPLQIYLERTDFWSDPVTEQDLTTFEVEEKILLKHTFVILSGLEKKHRLITQQQQLDIQNREEQQQNIQTWFDESAKPMNSPKVIDGKKANKGKIRV